MSISNVVETVQRVLLQYSSSNQIREDRTRNMRLNYDRHNAQISDAEMFKQQTMISLLKLCKHSNSYDAISRYVQKKTGIMVYLEL